MYDPKVERQKVVGSQWNGVCPFCGSDRFYMNRDTGLWDCKKCGLFGNWYQFKRQLREQDLIGSDDETPEEKKKRKSTHLKKVRFTLVDGKEEEKAEEEHGVVELPNGTMPIKRKGESKVAYDYILKREFNPDIIKKYGFMYCNTGLFFNRIIMPVFMEGELKAYIGRWIDVKGIEPKRKYRNSFGMQSSKLVWNFDNIVSEKPLVIAEGVFSAIRIGGNVAATFGKKFSEYQARELSSLVKHIVFVFDAGASVEIIKAAENNCMQFKRVSVVFLEEGDPDENRLTYEEVMDMKQSFSPKKFVPSLVG